MLDNGEPVLDTFGVVDYEYMRLGTRILHTGEKSKCRNGYATGLFGEQIFIDCTKGFPILTTKKIFFRGIVEELIWMFIHGGTNSKDLEEKGVNIWREWAGPRGELGPIYGKQFCRWGDVRFVEPKIFEKPHTDLDPSKVAGVGFNGEHRSDSDIHKMLYSIWNEMLHRCYDPTRKHFKFYGEKGIFVDARWFDFLLFVEDVQKLPGWAMKLAYPAEFELDKDFCNANKYSKETCMWLSEEENKLNTSQSKLIKVTEPDGNTFLTMDIPTLAKEYRLDISSIYKAVRGEIPHVQKFKFEQIEGDGLPRMRKLNQIKQAAALLKHDPWSRRNYVSAWNPSEIDQMHLPPCHVSHQLKCGGEDMQYLDMHMVMRSTDFALGLPFNISQYALLLFLYARECEKIPRNLVISLGDVHIYAGHEEGIEAQLSREPKPLPTLAIDAFTSMFEMDSKQIRLEGYQSHSKIDFEVFA